MCERCGSDVVGRLGAYANPNRSACCRFQHTGTPTERHKHNSGQPAVYRRRALHKSDRKKHHDSWRNRDKVLGIVRAYRDVTKQPGLLRALSAARDPTEHGGEEEKKEPEHDDLHLI